MNLPLMVLIAALGAAGIITMIAIGTHWGCWISFVCTVFGPLVHFSQRRHEETTYSSEPQRLVYFILPLLMSVGVGTPIIMGHCGKLEWITAFLSALSSLLVLASMELYVLFIKES